MSRIHEALKVMAAEEVAKSMSWREIIDLVDTYGYHGFTNDPRFKSAKQKLTQGKFESVTKDEFRQIEGALKSSESYMVKHNENDMGRLLRAIFREHSEFRRLKDKFGGCYIATAVYGSYDEPQVIILRRFRDDILEKTTAGRWFIDVYYKLSPKIASKLKNRQILNKLVKNILDTLVKYFEKRL
jgi:hypothetical protein